MIKVIYYYHYYLIIILLKECLNTFSFGNFEAFILDGQNAGCLHDYAVIIKYRSIDLTKNYIFMNF